ncbi:MAG: radical SAM protein [Nitrospirota bacterium]|nr:radical SAM protein [Nitrospirota bacterium]
MVFPLPQYLQLYPTARCNQDCNFCFNSRSAVVKDMSPENALNLLDIMLALNISDLDIMGGEPFLLPWMPSFLHAAIKEGIMVNISTNGSFPEVMEEFRGLRPEQINIGISLEGSSGQTHNRLTNAANFEKALSSISTLVSMGLNPIVKTVVTGATMPGIQSIADLLIKLGVKRYYLIHMDLLSKADSHQLSAIRYPDFLSYFHSIRSMNASIEINKVNASCFEKQTLPKGVRCAGGVKKLSVMPDGSVYPCNLFQQSPEFSLGNIFTDAFSDIWSSPRLTLFRSFSSNKCSVTDCSNHSSCTGGCPAHAVLHGYGLHAADIRCLRH